MATDVQLLRSGSFESVDFADWSIDVGISPRLTFPKAEVELSPRESVDAKQDIRIQVDGSTVFTGHTESGGTKRKNSPMAVKCRHDAAELFNATASVFLEQANATNETVLNEALERAGTEAFFTLVYNGTASSLENDYIVFDRPVIDIFRDIMDRTDQVWWVDPGSNEINVDGAGDRGSFATLDAGTDKIQVESFDSGNVETVRNDVVVIGTGDQEVVGTAEDSTSQSNYGVRSTTVNVGYATSQAEVDKIAQSLIQADPVAEGRILVGRGVGAVSEPQVNKTVDLTDDSKNISETGLVIEKQTIKQGHAEFSVGEGVGTSIGEANRGDKSRRDVSGASRSDARGVLIAAKGNDSVSSGSTSSISTGIGGPGQDEAVLTPVGNFAGDSGPNAVPLHYTDPTDAANGVSMSLEWDTTNSEYLLNISNDHSEEVTLDWAVIKIPIELQEKDIGGGSMFITGESDDNLNSYILSTDWDISTASFNQSFDVSTQTTDPFGVDWNNDGTKLYITDNSSNTIYSYDCSTAYDISTASFNQSQSVDTENGELRGTRWNDDGSKLYTADSGNDKIHSYDASTAYDISTLTFNQTLDVSTEDSIVTGLDWNDDGSKLYMLGSSDENIYSYDCSTAFDISTASFNQSLDISSQTTDGQDIRWNHDGTKLYLVSFSETIFEYGCSTAYDISTASSNDSFDTSSNTSNPTGVAFKR